MMNIIERSTDDSAPLVIGLTGPIASGKSTVAELLRQRGAEIIDADQVYRSLVHPGSKLLQAIVDRFGRTVLHDNGDLNRPELSSVVFGDREALADLDHLTHPPVVAEIRRQISIATSPIVVVEAVKLTQTGLAEDLNALWLIVADEDIRVCRLMSRNGVDCETARSRVAAVNEPLPAGVSPEATIDTSHGMATTAGAVDAAWHALLESYPLHPRARLRKTEEAQ